jgi:hypothetical protein
MITRGSNSALRMVAAIEFPYFSVERRSGTRLVIEGAQESTCEGFD